LEPNVLLTARVRLEARNSTPIVDHDLVRNSLE